jgi:hypothetical protein
MTTTNAEDQRRELTIFLDQQIDDEWADTETRRNGVSIRNGLGEIQGHTYS